MSDAKNGKPSIIEYETFSGVLLHITPISLATFLGIELKAAEKFPYPDKKPYQQPEENAFSQEQLTPAEDNPEYVARCQAVDIERRTWRDKAVFAYAVKFPKYDTQQALVEAFVDKLKDLREIAILPENDYEAVLHHLVLTWNQPVRQDGGWALGNSEYARIIHMAIQTVALTPSEVTDGVKFFRPQI